MAESKLFYNHITIMKVLATFFITWFHFKWTVPSELSFLFVGGAFGNSLFFYASGYLLKFRSERFLGQWLLLKYFRVMPSIWIFMIAIMLFSNTYSNNLLNFFYPTPFWFVNCILCYFIVVYFLNKAICLNTKRNFVFTILVAFSIHSLYYHFYVNHDIIIIDEGGLKCGFYFFVFFIWGYYDKSRVAIYPKERKYIVYLLLTIVLFFIYKHIGSKYESLEYLQFIIIPVLLAFVVYSSICVSNYLSDFQVSNNAKRIIGYVANLTLDIYIVQMLIINHFMPLIGFPVNILVCMALVVLAAYINNYLASLLSKQINRIIA